MSRLMLWILASILFIVALALFIFLLWDKIPSIQAGSLALGEVVNLLVAFFTIVGIAIALGSLWISIATYQKSITDSETQQKNLDASRLQLQAVVDSATKQQEILSQNLETSKAQQELLSALLSKSMEAAKVQQEIQRKHLEISKAELDVLEAQQKREAELQARKPIAEIALMGNAGPSLIGDLEKQVPLDFPLDKNQDWRRVILLVSNKGNMEIIGPILRIAASPETVFVDHADLRYPQRREIGGASAYQFSGPHVRDIAPLEIAREPVTFGVDITVPNSINAFDLTFSIQGKNLARKTHTLHFKVVRASS